MRRRCVKPVTKPRGFFASRAQNILVVAFCLALSAIESRADDQNLRVAVWALSQQAGNPLVSNTVPDIMIMPAVFDSLTVVRQSGALSPSLSIAWEQKDPLTWEFKLRPNVKFSNGEVFNADAVTNAFSHLSRGVGATTAVARSVSAIDSVHFVDDLTVRVNTKYPSPLLPYEISSVRIPEPKHWNALGVEGFANDPIGTGPYEVVRWGKSNVDLKRFDGAWRKPSIEKLNVQVVPDETARLQALQSGAVDIALGLSQEAAASLRGLAGRLVNEKSQSILGLSFETTQKSVIQDARVRQALNFAVNREAILTAFYGNAVEPAGQITIPEAFGYDPTLPPYPYDPERARSLLKEAGYEDGFDFTIEVNTAIGGNAAAIFQQVASDLSKIGVRVELIQMSTVTFIQRIALGGWKGMAFTMDYNSTRALDGLKPFQMHSCLRPIPWYCNPSDTPLIEAALMEPDLGERERMIQGLLRRYYEDPPGIILFQLVSSVGLSSRIRNYQADYGIIRFDEITYAPRATAN